MAVLGRQFTDGTLLGLVLICAVLFGFFLLIYRLFLSPLSKIPGHWLTRISSIPEANALKQNRRAQWITDLFEQSPDTIAIRTGPNSVSFNHPDAVKEIYGMLHRFKQCRYYTNDNSRSWQNRRWIWEKFLVRRVLYHRRIALLHAVEETSCDEATNGCSWLQRPVSPDV